MQKGSRWPEPPEHDEEVSKMQLNRNATREGHTLIQDPPIARFLFQSTGIVTVFWLLVRLFTGYQWLMAGWEKFNDPAWMGGTGAGILGFWQRAVAIPATGRPLIAYDWYRAFLQFLIDSNTAPWFSK